MIVYLFNDDIFMSINLPTKVSGMYPMYVNDKLIVNIFSNDSNKWIVQLSKDLVSKEFSVGGNELIPYKIYNIVSSTGKDNFNMISIPKYDSNVYYLDVLKQVTIGNDPNCDIYFPYNSGAMEVMKVMPTGSNCVWTIETNSNHFFISGQRAMSGIKLMSGDYIFFYGLKIIFVGSRIIVNNPNNLLKLKSGGLQSHTTEPDYFLSQNQSVIQNNAPVFSKEDYYFKAPRFNFIIEKETVDIDEPPVPVQDDDIPVILTIGPQLTMVCASVLSMIGFLGMYMQGGANSFRFYVSIGTVAVTIIGAVLWPSITRRFNKKRIKKREEKRQKKYKEYLVNKKRQIYLIKEKQKSIIMLNHPSAEQCLKIISRNTSYP